MRFGTIFLFIVSAVWGFLFYPNIVQFVFWVVVLTAIVVVILRKFMPISALSGLGLLIIAIVAMYLGGLSSYLIVQRPQIEKAQKEVSIIFLRTSIEIALSIYYGEYDSYPTVEHGGLDALIPSYASRIPSREKIKYAYCLDEQGNASAYHLGVRFDGELPQSLALTSGTADFNSSIEDPRLDCEGVWYLENGTLGGFDGKDYYDVACKKLVCNEKLF